MCFQCSRFQILRNSIATSKYCPWSETPIIFFTFRLLVFLKEELAGGEKMRHYFFGTDESASTGNKISEYLFEIGLKYKHFANILGASLITFEFESKVGA